jgi:hypothetical protein
MRTAAFAVLNEPYILECEEESRNIDFLRGIDAGYFHFIADAFADIPDDPATQQRAAVSLRLAYHHAMETFFSLVGCLLQAPECAYAWLAKCQTVHLRKLVGEISSGQADFLRRIEIDTIDWLSISLVVHSRCDFEGGGEKAGKLFAELWQRLATEFLNHANINEYNSLKHGFRVRPGGFSLSISLDRDNAAGPRKPVHLGGSKYGSTYLLLEQVGGPEKTNRNYRSREHSSNWSLERTILSLHLLASSINNVVCMLKLLNDAPPRETHFERPSDDADFRRPWTYRLPVTHWTCDLAIPDEAFSAYSKEELLRHW